MVLAAFWPATRCGYFLWDDDAYFRSNPHVHEPITLHSIHWAFTSSHNGYAIPLTTLAWMAQYQLWGALPAGYHWVNLILHATNAVLLFLVLRQLTGAVWRSALVAALFALHPQRVESVVWLSELKDVLSTALALLTIMAYAAYARTPRGYAAAWRYALVLLISAAGLLAKPMLVTLPCLLLLLDFWPLQRVRSLRLSIAPPATSGEHKSQISNLRSQISDLKSEISNSKSQTSSTGNSEPHSSPHFLLLEKLPLLAMALGICWWTWFGQQRAGVINNLDIATPSMRLANVVVSYVRYLEKMVRVDQLGVFYPYPPHFPDWQVGGAVAILAGITAVALWQWRRRPFLLVGWLWYLGLLVPVIGFVQINAQAMADRFSYLPSVGVFIMLVWSIPASLCQRPSARRPLILAAGAIVIALCAYTRVQAGYWRDNAVLLEHTIAVTPANVVAQQDLGNVLADRGDFRDAAGHFRQAASLNPRLFQAQFNLGVMLGKLGQNAEAIAALRKAVALDPGDANAHYSLGVLLAYTGSLDEAAAQIQEAVRLQPANPAPRQRLAAVRQLISQSAATQSAP